ncbi:MAG: hypothetical protein ABIY71_11085 [Flavobacteriales bacterium]
MKGHALAVAVLLFTGGLFAQATQLSLGVDVAIPLREFNNRNVRLGRGPAVGFELPVGDRVGVTLQAAYDFLVANDSINGRLKSAVLIPVQAGLKYYFQGQQKGFYAHGQLGIHDSMKRYRDFPFSSNDIEPTWALGVGYQLEQFDFGLRYNNLLGWNLKGFNPVGYLGVRVAYLFNLN